MYKRIFLYTLVFFTVMAFSGCSGCFNGGTAPATFQMSVTPDPIGTVKRAGKSITVSVPAATAGMTAKMTIIPGSNGYSSSIQADSSVTPPILGGETQTRDISTGAAVFKLLGTADGDDKIKVEIFNSGGTSVNSDEKDYETTST